MHYNHPLNRGFKSQTSKIFGIKKSIVNKGDETKKCALNLICIFIISHEAYEKNTSVLSSREEWSHNWVLAMELVIVSHVLFSRNLESIDTRLLGFME